MFKWLNKQGVESNKGFIVQCTGRFSLEYREDLKKIIIGIFDRGQHPNDQFFYVVKTDNFERWEDGSPITQAKQEEIKHNFTEAMAFQNIDIVIDDSPTVEYDINNFTIKTIKSKDK